MLAWLLDLSAAFPRRRSLKGCRNRWYSCAVGAAVSLAAFFQVLFLPSQAAAAGAEAFSISGPGLEKPIEISLYGLDAPELIDLPEQMGAWFLTSGEAVMPMMPTPPTPALGPKYIVTWYMLGPTDAPRDERAVRQELYPEAEGGPLLRTPEGQGLWSGAVGWYRPPERFSRSLALLNIPSTRGQSPDYWLVGCGILVAATSILAGPKLWARKNRWVRDD